MLAAAVVMTAGARQFVTPLTFQALSGRPVRTDLWDEAAEAYRQALEGAPDFIPAIRGWGARASASPGGQGSPVNAGTE